MASSNVGCFVGHLTGPMHDCYALGCLKIPPNSDRFFFVFSSSTKNLQDCPVL